MRLTAILMVLVAILGRSSSVPRPPTQPGPEEIWKLTLPEAIRIGLDNSEVVRAISTGATEIPLGGFEPAPSGFTMPYDPEIVGSLMPVGPAAPDSKP